MSIKKNDHPWEDKSKKPIERYKDCKKCDATGELTYLLFFSKKCENCRGTGKLRNI